VTVGELHTISTKRPQNPVFYKGQEKKPQMDRKFHTVSIEDREMFAYNKRYNDLQKHLAQPENRIKYSYEFYNDYQDDREMQLVAFEKSLHYISIVEDQTAHF
jgi:hypothetical protein